MLRNVLSMLVAFQVICLTAQADPPPAAPLPAKESKPTVTTEGCTVEFFTVPSPSMGRDIRVTVLLPPGYTEHREKTYPILYALHGRDAPYDAFANMPPLRAALKDKPMIVACFDGDHSSWYLDSALPQKWSRDKNVMSETKSLFTTFFFDEYIPALDRKYRIEPKKRMLTGFSMGGFGAFHFLLAKPEMFIAVSAMSGGFFDLLQLENKTKDDDTKEMWAEALGPFESNQPRYVAADLYTGLAAAASQGVKFPPLFLTCGTEDEFLSASQGMRDSLKKLNIACEYQEGPGKHDWAYWKTTSPHIIDFHWRAATGK